MLRIRIPNLGKRGTSGTAAIEFALIAPVFFLMLFAILETGMVFFAGQTLQHGVVQTARLIRTGQAANQNMTQAQFRTQLCNQVSFLLTCDPAKLYIDVRSYTNFAGSGYPQPLDAGSNIVPSNVNSYSTGGSSNVAGAQTIVLVRAFYTWQLFTPLFGNYFANMANNQRLLSASVAFKNEPY